MDIEENLKIFEVYQIESGIPVIEEIVSLSKAMVIGVNDGNISDHIEEHSEELTTDEPL